MTLDTGLESAENTVTSAQYREAEQDGGDEAIVLHGSAAASFVVDDKQDGNFTIRLFDTYGVANGVLPAESRFFDSITAKNDGAGTLTFTCKKGAESYFGYNLSLIHIYSSLIVSAPSISTFQINRLIPPRKSAKSSAPTSRPILLR